MVNFKPVVLYLKIISLFVVQRNLETIILIKKVCCEINKVRHLE